MKQAHFSPRLTPSEGGFSWVVTLAPNMKENAQVSGKLTVLSPSQPNPPAKVHNGWKRSRKPLKTAGDCKSLNAWVIRQTLDGYMHPEDARSITWMITQQMAVIEKADLEARLAEALAKVEEVTRDAR